LTVLPQGWTDSPAVFQNDVAFILQEETDIAPNFQDDVNVLGPRTRYKLPDGTYETISANPGIRRFVWEHCVDANRILHRLRHAGATVSASKLFLCIPEVLVVGHLCTYEGRIPDSSKVSKISNWPPCSTKTEVRGFLGTAGTVQNWIKNYALLSRPLTHLTRNNSPFIWSEEAQQAMDAIKNAIISSSAIQPINYTSQDEVILAVDSSHIACGWILSQVVNKKRYPSRFGSITWNDCESRYSQAKLELYGLFRALRAAKVWLISLKHFTVEVDAKYIQGMLNNPDIQPNAAVNRWITGISLFDFTLRHVPASKHVAPDGLSRRPRAPEDDEDEMMEDVDEWIEEVLGCGLWVAAAVERSHNIPVALVSAASTLTSDSTIPSTELSLRLDRELQAIHTLLDTLAFPSNTPLSDHPRLRKCAYQFFVRGQRLWRKESSGRHQLVIFGKDRLRIMTEAHDVLGHKGFYSTRRTISDRFWWPTLDKDLTWYLKTCHQCQIRSVAKVVLPPTISIPSTLF